MGLIHPAPVVRVPKNWRQVAWGGATCAKWGLEYDKWGREVTGDNVPPPE